MFIRELGEKEGKEKSTESDHIIWSWIGMKDLVVVVDFGFEGRMLGDEVKQIGILLTLSLVDRIEDQ